MRRGETDLVIALIDSARQRVLRAQAPAMRFLVDAWEAGLGVRIGELERTRELLDTAERLIGGAADPGPARPGPRGGPTAALADALELHHQAAVRLGAASRLRGAHDLTDPQVRGLTRSARAALGADSFAAAYGRSWELDHRTAVTEVDPARLSRDHRTR
ncbi:hypothetical protein ACFVGY_18755 [Streptomyces sp. NPDC127106]|uniref:hypothetical protein n=1 Tax=Streptomyces sp. NPDC127106 TaxID=3345360 RepID=UPI003641404A